NGMDVPLNRTILLEGGPDDGVEVATTQTLADQGRTVILTPEVNLKPNTYYSLGYASSNGSASYENFTTGGDPASEDIEARSTDVTSMTLVRNLPHNEFRTYPITNDYVEAGSVIRLSHSQPIDPATVLYAEDGNIKIVQEDDGIFVPAMVVGS